MAVTLFVLFLLAIALTLVGISLSLRMRLVKAETETVVRGALADAALDEAVAHLVEEPGFPGSPRHALGEGEIESDVVLLGSRRYVVTATGHYAGRPRTLQATVFRSDFGATIESWRLVAGDGPTPR